MEYNDKVFVACQISSIFEGLKHIDKALERALDNDDAYDILDRILESVYMRLEEIEHTLDVWGEPPHDNTVWEGYKSGWEACEDFYESYDKAHTSGCKCDSYNHRMD